MTKININGVIRDYTAEEQAEYDAKKAKLTLTETQMKLQSIKDMRLLRLKETDFYALSDVTMSDAMSTYRQSMRDIPQDYSADKYDELLARDEQGNLTHTVWEKP